MKVCLKIAEGLMPNAQRERLVAAQKGVKR